MAARLPRLAINDSLSPVSETGSPIDPTARKLTLFRKIRPLPLKHAWTFYHDKASYQSSTTYENRLTPLHENIITVQKFWEVWNSFPFESLRLKDSVHLFKRGVKPVWEDRRNINGGAWTFRIPKGRAVDFFEAILLMAVGEQFNDKMEPGDDICGISMSVRFNANLISIWNRRGSSEKSREAIMAVVLNDLPSDLEKLATQAKPEPYYKQHSEHTGFSELVTKADQTERHNNEQRIVEAEVGQEESDRVLLKSLEVLDPARSS